jgi:hypothetical protein
MPKKPRGKPQPKRLSQDETQKVLARFGAVLGRESCESVWVRPKPGGGTWTISVARHPKPLATGTLGSIVRQSNIDKDDFWKAAYDRHWPPPIVTTSGGLGLTAEELRVALQTEKIADVQRWCAGEAVPAAEQDRLDRLEQLRTQVQRNSDKWPIWKWLREPHPQLGNIPPVAVLGDVDDPAALLHI